MSTMAPASYDGDVATSVAVDDDDDDVTRNSMSTVDGAPTIASMTSSKLDDTTSTPMTLDILAFLNPSLIDDDNSYADPPSFMPATTTPPVSSSDSSRMRPSGFARDRPTTSYATSFVDDDDNDDDDTDVDVDVLLAIATESPPTTRRVVLEGGGVGGENEATAVDATLTNDGTVEDDDEDDDDRFDDDGGMTWNAQTAAGWR